MISDDVRAAAEYMEAVTGHPAKYPEALVTRLRAHADLLDALRDRMARDLFREGPVPRFICDKWLEALYTGSLE